MINIFLSYRRQDTFYQIGRLHDHLVQHFGPNQVFKYDEAPRLGDDFRTVLTERVAACDVLLAVIGDLWLSVAGPNGKRRLDDPNDFVRFEIEAALDRKIPVIPVLVGDAFVPQPKELPRSLRGLSFRYAQKVRYDTDFHNDIGSLIRGIEKRLNLSSEPEPRDPDLDPLPPPDGPLINSIGMKLTLIPAGEFLMGDADEDLKMNDDIRPPVDRIAKEIDSLGDDPDFSDDEKPPHRVRLTQPFYLGIHEVTQAEYRKVMGLNPSWFTASGSGGPEIAGIETSRFPVESVSWFDAVEFCNRLSKKEKLKPCYEPGGKRIPGANGYRLPTEAEWEYACRAAPLPAPSTSFTFGASLTSTEANFDGANADDGEPTGPYLERTTTVGIYPPNAFGLHDMHGNVSEWCSDWYDARYYENSPRDDPQGGPPAMYRVVRGGHWDANASICRSAFRSYNKPEIRISTLGFRVARSRSEP